MSKQSREQSSIMTGSSEQHSDKQPASLASQACSLLPSTHLLVVLNLRKLKCLQTLTCLADKAGHPPLACRPNIPAAGSQQQYKFGV